MKFKLKQPTKYMHQNLENQSDESQKQSLVRKQQKANYKQKKIIKKKNQPSATRHNKINQTFQKIYNTSYHTFQDLNINMQSLNKLAAVQNKHKCLCDKNVKFYCLKCMQKVCQEEFPKIQLPFQITVIHHQSEKVNKSSALPLKFLTQQIKFYYFSSLEEEKNNHLWAALPKPTSDTHILFPHKQSKLISEIAVNEQKKINIKNLIILDCTWFQTDQLIQILHKKGYNNYIRIQGYKSIYWRYNHHNDQALCSAQAITFFMRQYQKAQSKEKIQESISAQKKSNGNQITGNKQPNFQIKSDSIQQLKKYDNLLFLYCLNLKMIMKGQNIRMDSNKEPSLIHNPIQN